MDVILTIEIEEEEEPIVIPDVPEGLVRYHADHDRWHDIKRWVLENYEVDLNDYRLVRWFYR